MIVTMKHRPIIAAARVSVEIDFDAKSLTHNLSERRIFYFVARYWDKY